jgi:hypothetical protein
MKLEQIKIKFGKNAVTWTLRSLSGCTCFFKNYDRYKDEC